MLTFLLDFRNPLSYIVQACEFCIVQGAIEVSGASDPKERDVLLKEVNRKIDRIERFNANLSRELAYIREIVSFRIKKIDFEESFPLQSTAYTQLATSDFDGINWYGPEDDGSESFRWSGPGLLSTILLPLNRKVQLVCRIKIIGFCEGVPNNISVFIDGSIIPSRFDAEISYLDFFIPESDSFRLLTEIGLLAASVRQPAKGIGKSPDDRWLGFKFKSIEVFAKI